MAFERITDGDLLGKGNLGRPDTPGVDTAEMQRILDELPREVIVPAFNRLAGQLEDAGAAAGLGAAVPGGLPADTPATVQGALEAVLAKTDAHSARADNPHAVTAAQTGAYTKEEADAAIDRKVVEIGAGDMARSVYDPTGQAKDVFAAIGQAVAGAGHMEKSAYAAAGVPGAVDRALAADTALAADDGVKVYAHTKSGTVHEFTGAGANGRAKMTADVQAGDTFTVNGAPVTACMGAESAADAMAGGAWSGKWVTFVFDGSALNFKGGGGGAALKIASAASKDQLPTPAKGIGVITTTAAGNAVVSFDEPAAPSAGDVWIRQGRFSPEVQVSKNPVVNIAPAEVLQWDGAAWASRDGYRAEGGAWVPLQAYLYRDGTVIVENAGSFIAGYNYRTIISFREDSVYLTAPAGGDNAVGYDLTTAVFSKKNTLHGLWRAITIPNNGDGRLCAFPTNGTQPTLLNKTVGLRTHKPGDVFEASADLTGISGEYRLGFGMSSNGSSSKFEIELLRLWVD